MRPGADLEWRRLDLASARDQTIDVISNQTQICAQERRAQVNWNQAEPETGNGRLGEPVTRCFRSGSGARIRSSSFANLKAYFLPELSRRQIILIGT